MFFLLLLILPGLRTQSSTPSNLLGLGRYNHHTFNAVTFVQGKHTKNGPVLFPNDAPPPPPTPLIVTSRPLSESIAKSELNTNNSQAAQSQLNQISFKPEYLARGKNYQPFSYPLTAVTPLYDYEYPQEPYDVENKVQGSRKDLYYTDFEKRLMESIHQRKDTYKEEHLWDRPIYRRRMKQGHTGKSDARKTILTDEEKSLDLKVKHGSLYSREANENNYEDDNDVPVQKLRRMNYEENKSRRIVYHKSDIESDSHSSVRRIRPFRNMAAYNKNRKRRPIPKPISLSDNEDRKMEIREKRTRPFQNIYSPRGFHKSRFRRPHENKDSLSDIDDRKREERLFHKAKTLSDSEKRNRKPFKKNDNDNRNQIRLLQKFELFDNRNRKPIYKTEDQINRSLYSSKIANNNHYKNGERKPTHRLDNQERPPHSVDNLSQDNSRNKVQKPSHRTEDNKSKYRSMRQTHQKPSEEMIQPRKIRPLYAVSSHYNHVEQTTHKPYHYKSQEKSPDYSNYFDTNERGNVVSKDYNHGDNYAFSYTVKDHKTGDDFSHSQQSRGSSTNGEYRVRLPDGRMQIVSYTADENGYKADVRYDERHHQANSIDLDTSRENGHHKNDRPIHFKNNNAFDHFNSQDFSNNRDYIDHQYKNDNTHNLFNEHTNQPSRRPTIARNRHGYQNDVNENADHHTYDHTGHTNDQTGHNYDHTGYKNVDAVDHKDGSITDSNNDYLEHYKDKKYDKVQKGQETDYFLISNEVVDPISKEIVDYSSELNEGYRPHASKFSTFNEYNVKPTVKPSYEELKHLFVTSRRLQNNGVPVVSTEKPDYGVTTENIVVIGAKHPNLYTNIREAVPVTPSPITYSTPFASTPSGYLLSTIANLKSQVNLVNKPVLSNRYIDKINKYLTYK